jgi:hypothetical protein
MDAGIGSNRNSPMNGIRCRYPPNHWLSSPAFCGGLGDLAPKRKTFRLPGRRTCAETRR